MKVYDITIIGGGPVGLFTAFYAGMRQASVKIIESLPELGGQLTALYPDKYVYDVAGFKEIKAGELVGRLTEQMSQFQPDICTGEEVQEVEKSEDYFTITTSKDVHYSKTIIITAGNGAFKPRTMNLPREEEFEEMNLHYRIQSLQDFKDKQVVIFGGGDSAVDWALMLEKIAAKVTIVHRRDRFRAHEHSVQRMKESNVEIVTPFVPKKIIGSERINEVEIVQAGGEETRRLEADEFLVNYGFISNLGPINDWQLHIEKNCIVVNSRAETNIPGIYAVGDISTYPGKVKLMATGFGEAPIAVSNAKVFINPEESLHGAHSTSIMSRKNNKQKKARVLS
ncbi:NAD(P)/FAD-dependent oxidoreductase [Oceanobacillus piezotolerans]|uniref:Ferredoxin--NADP reductase n=1 Tax=Oceanobacillus piezotolerans TaxID=2448030 RepID=A0A498D578_9BACI|nr:NAD(P)/FAD-dependent oxidoreductase [Oceanobacillus piezotolerans]RLL44829.1 NAD(P)/FAD-dependent oxidoreductase [Oceanobacillus piezotolerans]